MEEKRRAEDLAHVFCLNDSFPLVCLSLPAARRQVGGDTGLGGSLATPVLCNWKPVNESSSL